MVMAPMPRAHARGGRRSPPGAGPSRWRGGIVRPESHTPFVKQRAFDLRSWGGARRGAGRKPQGQRSGGAHRARERFRGVRPVHVSLRAAPHVWNLRSERSFGVIHGALEDTQRRPGFDVVQYAILGNHLHLIVEADGSSRLSTGVRALAVRLARRLNRMMGRTGPVFEARFHAHVLRTPPEAKNAARYVASNHRNHLARKGLPAQAEGADRYSSDAGRAPRTGQLTLWPDAAARPPRTSLMRSAGRGTDEIPGGREHREPVVAGKRGSR